MWASPPASEADGQEAKHAKTTQMQSLSPELPPPSPAWGCGRSRPDPSAHVGAETPAASTGCSLGLPRAFAHSCINPGSLLWGPPCCPSPTRTCLPRWPPRQPLPCFPGKMSSFVSAHSLSLQGSVRGLGQDCSAPTPPLPRGAGRQLDINVLLVGLTCTSARAAPGLRPRLRSWPCVRKSSPADPAHLPLE